MSRKSSWNRTADPRKPIRKHITSNIASDLLVFRWCLVVGLTF